MEPQLLAPLEAKQARQRLNTYKPRETSDVTERLNRLLEALGRKVDARNVQWMGGGASKEQFIGTVVPAPGAAFVDPDDRHMGQPAMLTRFVGLPSRATRWRDHQGRAF